MGVRRGNTILAVAAVLAGITAIGLIVFGLWLRHGYGGARHTDPAWWAGVGSQALGYLALGKGGLKAALAVLLGASAVVAWIRGRRSKDSDAEPERPE
ncbi:hypothetical protein [Phytohabitans rumicis]|uniref:Uncharacterized protein n=1 Tax=Phytohabitans rumicis TaxID=1076125 RepID=A0A6V8LCG1_9ACTN|nr:hypothetical protein [Phytohabitans rumicis]GFJ92279.1 hypothetical protein Prum_059210 [Phytohabitans rumicis]